MTQDEVDRKTAEWTELNVEWESVTGAVALVLAAVSCLIWPTLLRLENCRWGLLGDYSRDTSSDVFHDITWLTVVLLLGVAPATFHAFWASKPLLKLISGTGALLSALYLIGYASVPIFDPDGFWTASRCRG